METCDVLIVGGGPAGSACAWKLQQAGVSTLIVDKQPFPRVKPCAGWITPQLVEDLQLDAADYAATHTWQPITGFRCGTIGGRETCVDYGKTVSYGIRRYEFDDYLLRRCGSPLKLDEAVTSFEKSGDRWIVNGRYSAALLIGAGGTFCPVARHLGARNIAAGSVVAQEVEFEADPSQSNVTGEHPALYFCADMQGYGWCFRKGNFLNIGLGRLVKEHLSQHVAEFWKFLQERGVVKGEPPGRWLGHAYQLYDCQPPVLSGDGVLLIGDAAGLAYRESGEGIRPAVESGMIAADVILGARGQYDRTQLQSYERRLTARLGRPGRRQWAQWLPSSWLQGLAGRLLAQPWFCRSVVLDRWFLHRSEKALSL